MCGYFRDGDTADGPFVTPKIYEVTPDDPLARDEVFGPILAVLEVASTEEAIALANDTAYGLTASVFTSNIRTAHRVAKDLRAGTVTVNCYGEGDAATPFGGYKQSGFGGRDNGVHAHDQYTELKTIWIDLDDRQRRHGPTAAVSHQQLIDTPEQLLPPVPFVYQRCHRGLQARHDEARVQAMTGDKRARRRSEWLKLRW